MNKPRKARPPLPPPPLTCQICRHDGDIQPVTALVVVQLGACVAHVAFTSAIRDGLHQHLHREAARYLGLDPSAVQQ